MKPSAQGTKLNGLTIHPTLPRVVAETTRGRCWYPDLLKFSTGELMLNHSVNADANTNEHNSQAVYLSTDGGRTWGFAYDVNGFHNGGGEPRTSLPDGRIVGTSTFLKPDPPAQGRRFRAHRWTYDQGGRRYSVEPWGALVEGFPRNILPYPEPSRTWWARINWFSDIVRIDDGRWISTISMRYEGDQRETTEAFASDDEGRRWRRVGTVAGPDAVADATEGFDEPCLVQLADDGLMCVSRVGSGKDQLLARGYSADGGRTWSALDRLPAWSVAPQILRLQNGALALSTGRPGVFLWLSTDARGREWAPFDVMAYHNAVLPAAAQLNADQTTAYTAMVETSPNRLLLVYDRTPFGWGAVSAESKERSQIWLMEAVVERG